MIPYTKSLYFIYFIFKYKKEKIGIHLKKTGKLVFGTSIGQVFEGMSKNRRLWIHLNLSTLFILSSNTKKKR